MPQRRAGSALTPRKAPAQERSRATVAAILTAAARIFATHGYAAGTPNRIAARAGVSIGSLYEYFPNKDALLVALVEAHMSEGEAVLLRTAAEVADARLPLPEAVRRFVTAMVSLHAQDPAFHRVIFEESPLPPRVRRRLADIEGRACALLAAYLEAHPEFTRDDPALAARIVVQTVEALSHRLGIHARRSTDVQAQIDEITSLVAGYLTAGRRPGA